MRQRWDRHQRLIIYCGGDRVAKRTGPHETYDIEASTLVRRTLGSLKGTLEVEGRIINQVDLDVGCLVILAICSANPRISSIHAIVASNSKVYVPAISLFTRRKRASMVQRLKQMDRGRDRERDGGL